MPAVDRQAARELVRRLRRLSGGPDVVRKAAARALAERPPTEAAELLHLVMALAREGWEPAETVQAAFTRALELEAEGIPHVATLRRVAALQVQVDVELLFAEGLPAREYDAGAAARADAKLFSAPLGWLKTQARLTRNPDELARLAVASNASVVREVLRNPRMTEELVVRIAARRPARPEPLAEIWRSGRWSTRPAVRRALVFNPYLPPEHGAKIVPLLTRADWRDIAGDGSLHASLRQQAQELLAQAGAPQKE